MNEFETPDKGVKHMRETIDRKDDAIKKLETELASYKEKEIDNVFGKLGLSTDNGFGKALKQVYDGPVTAEAISQFAKEEYGYDTGGVVEAQPQAEAQPVVQDDALDVSTQLQQIVQKGTVQDSLRAKLTLLETDK